MDIPKFVGVLYGPIKNDQSDWWSVRAGNDEAAVKADVLAAYQKCVAVNRAEGRPESFIEQIGWDVYVSTRASANAPDAVHHGFEGPGAEWQQYKRKGLSEMKPWTPDLDMSNVSISDVDKINGSPKVGDMIVRNPKNHTDQWLVAAKYFADNLEPA